MELRDEILDLCKNAKAASAKLALADTEQKNGILLCIARILREHTAELTAANRLDLDRAADSGLAKAMIDRLTLSEKRVETICRSLEELVNLEDPIGKGESWERPSGITIRHIRVPLGVVAIIYEARPNVTVDSAALCLKTGNAVVLRGGKEAIHTNKKLVELIKAALSECGFDPHCVELITSTDRESAQILMNMRGYLDVLIPRGGKGLIQNVVQNATVPVIETGAGNCHLYVDDSADMDMALKIAVNAKCSRPSVCAGNGKVQRGDPGLCQDPGVDPHGARSDRRGLFHRVQRLYRCRKGGGYAVGRHCAYQQIQYRSQRGDHHREHGECRAFSA